MKMSANELANKLEEKAKQLRENGLTKEDMEMIAGGACVCCGSSCEYQSEGCYTTNECRFSCIYSSPD